ncbi:MAG: hypothetical protein MHM6MM_000402 [Cercozoa sp. M6MM]
MVHTSAWIAGGVTGAVIVGAQLKGMLQRAAVNSTHWTLDNSDFTEQRASDLPPPTSATENAATFVTEPLQRREIPLAQTGVGALPPETIAQVLERAERRNGSAIALKVERDGKWKEWTYSQFAEDCRRFARFLLSPEVDLPRAASVCIMGFNSPEWVIAHIGTILAGGLSAGVYVTNGTEECKYIAEHCEARVVVADSMKQIEKFADAGSVTTRVVWDPALAGASTAAMSDDDSDAGVVTFSDALSVGDTVEETKLRARVAELCPEQACQLIYTSGTTGPPKGVMLSHDNATWTAKAMCQSVLQNFCTEHTEHLVSFLPFSHVAAQLADIYCALLMLPSHAPYAVTVWFARPDALKGSLVQTLRTARPTAFFGVPRVFEKMMTAMVDKAKDAPALVKSLAAWAKSVGCEADQATQGRLTTPTVPVSYLLANKLVFSKVKQALGFDRIKRVWSAAAPISKEVQLYFGSLGIVVGDVFGMSECTGPHCVSRLRARRHGALFLVGLTPPPYPPLYLPQQVRWARQSTVSTHASCTIASVAIARARASCACEAATCSWATCTTRRRVPKVSTRRAGFTLVTWHVPMRTVSSVSLDASRNSSSLPVARTWPLCQSKSTCCVKHRHCRTPCSLATAASSCRCSSCRAVRTTTQWKAARSATRPICRR